MNINVNYTGLFVIVVLVLLGVLYVIFPRNHSVVQATIEMYRPHQIFEYEGCKVYQFNADANHYAYYSNCQPQPAQ